MAEQAVGSSYTRPVWMVSIIANGTAMTITTSASTVTIISRRSVKSVTYGRVLLCQTFG